MKIALCQINPTVGALENNCHKIVKALAKAEKEGAEVALFSELCLLGYPPEDLLSDTHFVEECERALERLIPFSKGLVAIFGTIRKSPFPGEKRLLNTAAIVEDGRLIGFQDKSLLPEYDVFYERRHFQPGRDRKLWTLKGMKCAVTICEDMWQHFGKLGESNYPYDPIEEYSKLKPDIVLNLSASPYAMGKKQGRVDVATKVTSSCRCPFVYCNQVGANDSLIFGGGSFALNEKGELVLAARSFEEDVAILDTNHFSTPFSIEKEETESLYNALVLGIKDYFSKQGFTKALVGLSGGIDSAVVACIAKDALGGNVSALYMPSKYNARESEIDAKKLAGHLNIKLEKIPIQKTVEVLEETLLSHLNPPKPLVLENLQSRIRGLFLMAFSNQKGCLVLNTGNKSELAVGYCTLYGDMCGALSVLSDVVKEKVYSLARYINRQGEIIPNSIIKKPPSAELAFDQKDSDTLPPYPILDAIVVDYIENGDSAESISKNHKIPLGLVELIIRTIHGSEYKRRQTPPGLRVTKKAFTVGRRVPIVQGWVK